MVPWHFPTKHYHSGKHLSDIQHSGEQVTAIFADETRDTADLLIGADGPNSTVTTLPAGCPLSLCRICRLSGINETELEQDAAALFTERFVFYHFPTRTFSNM